MDQKEGEIAIRTDAMNIPKTPPIPKPITPDMRVLPAQDSIAD